MLLNCAICVGLSTWMVIVPENLSAVYVGVFFFLRPFLPLPIRSLVYLAFESGGNANDSQRGGDDRASWQLQRRLCAGLLYSTRSGIRAAHSSAARSMMQGASACAADGSWRRKVTCPVLPLLLPGGASIDLAERVWVSGREARYAPRRRHRRL